MSNLPTTLLPAETSWRDVLASRVRYTVTCESEHTPIRGNVMDSGNEADDRAAEDEVIRQLRAGNEWAWCTVVVTCTLPGTELTACDALGCCSYASEADFCEPGGYFDDMKATAFDALCREFERVLRAGGLVA